MEKLNDVNLLVEDARALIRKGNSFYSQDQHDDAISIFKEVVSKYATHTAPEVQERVAAALFNKAMVFDDQGRSDDVLGAYNKIIELYGSVSDIRVTEKVASALINKASLLADERNFDDAVECLSDIISKYEGYDNLNIQVIVANAYNKNGIIKADSEDYIGAVNEFNVVIERIDERKESVFEQPLALAFLNKGAALIELGKNNDAIELFEKLIIKFEDSDDGDIEDLVEMARSNIEIHK